MSYRLTINDMVHEVDVDADTPLLWVLRDIIGLTGTKFGCGAALCGACTVHVAGEARRSCVTPVSEVGGAPVTTIEALGSLRIGRSLQQAWLDHEVVQCGYCQAGQLMQAAALLSALPKPDRAAIDKAMAGNICRCGTYGRIRSAIAEAAAKLREQA